MPTLQHGFHAEESRSDYNKTCVLQEIPTYSEYKFSFIQLSPTPNQRALKSSAPTTPHPKACQEISCLISAAHCSAPIPEFFLLLSP